MAQMYHVRLVRSVVVLCTVVLCCSAAPTKEEKFPEDDVKILTPSVPAYVSRYTQPWMDLPRMRFLSLEESNHRILYSPVRELGSEGLGHGMATKNAEVTAAFNLGLTYTHRLHKFGALSLQDPTVIEDFFSWGKHEVQAAPVLRRHCVASQHTQVHDGNKSELIASLRECNVCLRLKANNPLNLKNLVEIPGDLVYKHATQYDMDEFIADNNDSHTMFQMDRSRCAKSPIYTDFSISRPWFYWKYWERHAPLTWKRSDAPIRVFSRKETADIKSDIKRLKAENDVLRRTVTSLYEKVSKLEEKHMSLSVRLATDDEKVADDSEEEIVSDESYFELKQLSHRLARENAAIKHSYELGFNDDELTIAVHVRRGDFFNARHRVMVRSAIYAQVVRTVQDVVDEAGGPFAHLPVAVYIYSQGKPKNGSTYLTHQVEHLTDQYVDENGNAKTEDWWLSLLRRTKPQRTDQPLTRRSYVPKTPRVEFRISKPTIQSVHQMIAADIFIGSMSGLSTNVVRTLARGVQIYPGMREKTNHFCCSVSCDEHLGRLDRKALVRQWALYKKANERYLSGDGRSAGKSSLAH